MASEITRGRPGWVLSLLVGLLGCAPASLPNATDEPPAGPTFLLVGAQLVDGTGAPARAASVHVVDGRVRAIFENHEAPRAVDSATPTFDAGGLTLAPGFVDTHSHHDWGLLAEPDAVAALGQGVTTIVVGNDGGGPEGGDLATWFSQLEQTPAAIHVASYAGHNAIRARVLGDDFRRPATAQEVEEMSQLLRADLAAGALGLSTGLEYEPGLWSQTDEVLALARVAAAAGTRYISHMRSEDRELEAAIDELLAIGEQAHLPVQISHFKLARRSLWGRAEEILERLDAARARGIDVTADIYPYTYWQSTMTVLFPERAFNESNARYALDELAPPEGIRLTSFTPNPSLVGQTLAEIAEAREQEPWQTYLDLIDEVEQVRAAGGEATESILGTSMFPADIDALLRWPHSNVCSDGASFGGHPRGRGTYARLLGRLVREQGVLSLEEAVHKSSQLAARHVGLDRIEPALGTITPGAPADLVLFDEATVIDRADAENPAAENLGFRAVWVAGQLAWADGAATGSRSGQVLRRISSP